MDVLHAQALLMSTRRRQQAREHESNEEGEERRAAVIQICRGPVARDAVVAEDAARQHRSARRTLHQEPAAVSRADDRPPPR